MSPANPLHSLCCSDVLTKFERKKSAGLSGLVLTALIPTAVQSAIDIAVQAGGPAVKAAVEAAAPEIRQFVSNQAVKFLESCLAGLEDVKPAAQ